MKMTIFQRVAIGHFLILLLFLVLGVYIAVTLTNLNHDILAVTRINSTAVGQVDALMDDLLSQRALEQKYLITGDADYATAFDAVCRTFQNELSALQRSFETDEIPIPFERLGQTCGSYQQLFNEQVTQAASDTDVRSIYEKRRKVLLSSLQDDLTASRNTLLGTMDRKIDQISIESQRLMRVTLTLGLFAMVLAFGVSILNTRGISRSIKQLKRQTQSIGQGHFEAIEPEKAPAEFRELVTSFNDMSRRLKELDRLKQDFVSHVSHELRTPLAAVNEASAMLKEGVFEGQPAARKELLEIVENESARLIHSVNRILDLSKLEAGMMSYRFQKGDLVELVRERVLQLAPLAYQKEIDFELEPPQEVPAVSMDSEQMSQVVDNLIGNAIKFAPEKGRVNIRIEQISEPPQIKVSIQDNGPGIEPGNLEQIFDKFKRIESRQDAVHGTGLGLSIAKHILIAHKGSLWVESSPGAGSTFIFTLPVV